MHKLLTNQEHVTSKYVGLSVSAGHTQTGPPSQTHLYTNTRIESSFIVVCCPSSVSHAQQRTNQVRKHILSSGLIYHKCVFYLCAAFSQYTNPVFNQPFVLWPFVTAYFYCDQFYQEVLCFLLIISRNLNSQEKIRLEASLSSLIVLLISLWPQNQPVLITLKKEISSYESDTNKILSGSYWYSAKTIHLEPIIENKAGHRLGQMPSGRNNNNILYNILL